MKPNDQGPTTHHPTGLRRIAHSWRALNDWVKALLIAFVLLGFLHVFVLRFVTVRSSSMFATLWPGDLVAVARWKAWTGFERGDVVVFRDPLQDGRTMARRQLLVKRIVGLPGDEVRLRDGLLWVNGKRVAEFPLETKSWMLRLKKNTDPAALLKQLGLPPAFVDPGHTMIELPLNKAMAKELEKRDDVVHVEPMPSATGSPRHIFPFSPSPSYRWNSDDYGPIKVPKAGDVVRIDAYNIPMYDRIISKYEGNKLEADDDHLLVNGERTERYTVQQDYYFVLGDSRHYSADSRYWGFVPADHLVGGGAFVVMSSEPGSGSVRAGRWFTGL
jgi:signal peptidase I